MAEQWVVGADRFLVADVEAEPSDLSARKRLDEVWGQNARVSLTHRGEHSDVMHAVSDAGHRAAGLIPALAEEDAPRSASPRSVVA